VSASGTLWSTALRACLHGFEALGLDSERVRRESGIDESALADPDARVPLELTGRIWPAAQAQWRRPGLGLHTGAALPFGELGVIDYVMASAPTIAEGLLELTRVFRVVSQGATSFDFERAKPRGGAGSLEFTGIFPPEVRDYALGGIAARLSQLGARPTAVTFVGPPFDDVDEYHRILGAAPRFCQEANAIELDASDLDRRRTDDRYRGLLPIVGREVERLLSDLSDSTTSAEARRVVARLLPTGAPELETVARAMSVGARTLQRRLNDEGTSIRALVEATREELALSYLGSDRLRVAEIAYMLGYSEPGTFTTAFKRWRGASPSEFRGRRRE